MNQNKTQSNPASVEEPSEEVLDVTPCSHRNRRDVGDSADGMGHIIVHWCPDCGALKRTMTNWKCTDYPWEIPSRANSKAQEGESLS
jgi:hypothetical protein